MSISTSSQIADTAHANHLSSMLTSRSLMTDGSCEISHDIGQLTPRADTEEVYHYMQDASEERSASAMHELDTWQIKPNPCLAFIDDNHTPISTASEPKIRAHDLVARCDLGTEPAARIDDVTSCCLKDLRPLSWTMVIVASGQFETSMLLPTTFRDAWAP